jgi:glycosyltransferase involved in cell wall biosynthesis
MIASKRNVLLVVRPAEGGIRQHVLSLSRGLRETGWSPALAAPLSFIDALPPDHCFDRLDPVEIAPSFSPGDPAAAGSLRAAAASCDLVHAQGLRAAWIAALAGGRAPLVVTAHNLVPTGRVSRLILQIIARRTAAWLAVSPAIAGGLEAQGISPEKIRTVSNGVDVDAFRLLPSRDSCREALDIASPSFAVGYIGRLAREKGADVLLRAAGRLPDVAFVIAGDGPERDALRREAPANVRFAGRIADVRTVLAAVDALAIPSRQEGQGIVALEAMAAGVPIVASEVGGLAQTLSNGVTALLTPPEDAGQLADALMRLRDDADLRQSLTTQAHAVVAECYDIRKMWEETTAVYERVQSRQELR